jgi:hypothetical protein
MEEPIRNCMPVIMGPYGLRTLGCSTGRVGHRRGLPGTMLGCPVVSMLGQVTASLNRGKQLASQ